MTSPVQRLPSTPNTDVSAASQRIAAASHNSSIAVHRTACSDRLDRSLAPRERHASVKPTFERRSRAGRNNAVAMTT